VNLDEFRRLYYPRVEDSKGKGETAIASSTRSSALAAWSVTAWTVAR
jgi:hypothetical protein